MMPLQGAGLKVAEHLARRWQLDAARSRWRNDGFDWWPADYLVSVRIAHNPGAVPGRRWRATVDTRLAGGYPEGDVGQLSLDGYKRTFGTTHGWIVPPRGALRDAGGEPTLTFHSSIYFDDDEFLEDWLSLLACAGLFQPFSAQDHAAIVAGGTGSVPLRYPEDGQAAGGAEAAASFMLSAAEFFVPPMTAPSGWAGTGELAELTRYLSGSDRVFVQGDDTRVSAEVAFGDSTALLQILTELTHPAVGAGLGLRLRLPVELPSMDAIQLADRMNWEEATSWTGMAMMGNWVASDRAEDGLSGIDHVTFVPNALCWEGLAGNLALSMLARAEWVRRAFWPDIQDRPLSDILRDRFGR
ncbi:MAG: hypothetical protein GC147_14470 [Porphyrobacter sp.]|nr:hypothetical protein [Porphyrobacter sp.]